MHCFELTPNCSLSRAGAIRFFLLVSVAVLAVAGLCVAQGFWPVLPFAGAELVVLAWALTLVQRRAAERERLTVSDDRLMVEHLDRGGWRRFEVPRTWAQVLLERAPLRHYPSRLLIRSHGRVVEVGRFLTEEEREHLGNRLRELIRPDTGRSVGESV